MKGPNPHLAVVQPPVLEETARELHRLLDRHATRNPQLQATLMGDPAVVIALFRALEKTRPGSFEQVGDVGHALSMIGQNRFRRLLTDLPILRAVPSDGPSVPTARWAYSQAAHAAFYARALAAGRGMADNDELPTAALLQTPAILALWVTEPEAAQRASGAVRDGLAPAQAFGAELGEPLEQANQRLAEAWALPVLARQAMGDWDDFNPKPQIVRLGDDIAQATGSGCARSEKPMIAAVLADFLSLEEEAIGTWVRQCVVDAARHLAQMAYPLPAFEMLYLPGELPEEAVEKIPEMGAWRRRPTTETASKAPDVHATIADVMQRIREQAGTSRVVFAMLSQDRRRLRTRLALGGTREDGLRRLDLGLREKNLFSALMGKPQSIWLNPSNRDRFQAFLPESLRRILDAEQAYLMSLYVGDRPLGVMYGDGDALSDQGYRQFRELCREATLALSPGSDPAPARA